MRKELKKCSFDYTDGILTITTFGIGETGGLVKLSKVQMFSLMRFFVRVCQHNFRKKK